MTTEFNLIVVGDSKITGETINVSLSGSPMCLLNSLRSNKNDPQIAIFYASKSGFSEFNMRVNMADEVKKMAHETIYCVLSSAIKTASYAYFNFIANSAVKTLEFPQPVETPEVSEEKPVETPEVIPNGAEEKPVESPEVTPNGAERPPLPDYTDKLDRILDMLNELKLSTDELKLTSNALKDDTNQIIFNMEEEKTRNVEVPYFMPGMNFRDFNSSSNGDNIQSFSMLPEMLEKMMTEPMFNSTMEPIVEINSDQESHEETHEKIQELHEETHKELQEEHAEHEEVQEEHEEVHEETHEELQEEHEEVHEELQEELQEEHEEVHEDPIIKDILSSGSSKKKRGRPTKKR